MLLLVTQRVATTALHACCLYMCMGQGGSGGLGSVTDPAFSVGHFSTVASALGDMGEEFRNHTPFLHTCHVDLIREGHFFPPECLYKAAPL